MARPGLRHDIGEERSTPMREGVGRFSATLPAVVGALPEARRAFVQWLASTDSRGEDVDDLEVVFSELVTNAVHASDGRAAVEVHAWQDGSQIVMEVLNAVSAGGTTVHRWDLADELRDGGRGLLIVSAFVDHIAADRTPDGRVLIRCRRTLR